MAELSDPSEVSKKARVLLRARKFDEAIAVCEDSLLLDDEDPDVFEALATLRFLTGDYEAAIANFTQVTKLLPRRATPCINMGAVYNRMGEYNKAVEILRHGLQLDKKSSEGYYNLGIAYRQLKQWNMAVPAYREAIRLDPTMAEAYQNLGNVYSEMGNHVQALSQYKKALELKPGFERAQRGLEHAQKIIADEKLAKNPFGRLVEKPPDEEAARAIAGPAPRALTDDERMQDRRLVSSLVKSMAGEIQHVADALKSELEPRLRELTKSLTQQVGAAPLSDAQRDFRAAKSKYASFQTRFNATMQELRDHEARMQ